MANDFDFSDGMETYSIMEYTLGLRQGGLMEDPEWHVEDIQTVNAPTLHDAKQQWAEDMGYDRLPDWDPVQQSYWGWSVVEVARNVCKHCGSYD